jgi:CHAD domain-containing protein
MKTRCSPATRGILDGLAARFLRQLKKVRKDPSDAEAIHDSRVAARRLLAAGEMWAYGAPGWPALRDRLPRFVRRLGRVRNLDVALGLLAKGPAADRPARLALGDAFKRQRKRRRSRLRAWLGADRIRRVEKEIGALLDELRRQPLQLAPGPVDLAPYFARILSLSGGGRWTDDPAVAHEIRREIRRLRYAHETLAGAYEPADFTRAAEALRRVQEAAGEWQDRVVVAELAGRAVRKGRVAVPLAVLLQRLDAESKTRAKDFAAEADRLVALRPRMMGEAR